MDAIGGGGGLVTVPALLAAGLPPHAVLGTNKGQSVFGSLAALTRYTHAGLVDRAAARYAFPLAILGSAAGAALTLLIRPEVLRPLLLTLVVGAAAAVLLVQPRPSLPAGDRPTPDRSVSGASRAAVLMGLAALGIGAYDGFFGPGTGTLLIIVYTTLLHLPMTRATADAKVVNFGSNLAAVLMFAYHGAVWWRVALPMAGAQLLGGFIGAHLAVRRGDRFIRAIVLIVVTALVIKVGRDVLREGIHF